jgi:hypothetical protein
MSGLNKTIISIYMKKYLYNILTIVLKLNLILLLLIQNINYINLKIYIVININFVCVK